MVAIKLVTGRTAQEYNQRKNRNGAFWEDRYHAAAVSSDRHLIQYIGALMWHIDPPPIEAALARIRAGN